MRMDMGRIILQWERGMERLIGIKKEARRVNGIGKSRRGRGRNILSEVKDVCCISSFFCGGKPMLFNSDLLIGQDLIAVRWRASAYEGALLPRDWVNTA